MDISKEQIERMKKYGRKYGKEWTNQEAFEAANNLLGVFSLLQKIDMRLHPKRYKKKRR